MRLYSTQTREVEELKPLDGKTVRMYTCGPTVYDYAHIGNFRTFVFQDVLRRYLKYRGISLLHVMNITDVEDKIIDNAGKAGLSIGDYAKRYADAFFEDCRGLGIEEPEIIPYATQHIDEMVELITRLREKGHTYESEGSIYYRIDSFPEYGKLAHLDLTESRPEGRIDADEYTKENPRDFVLWKAKKEGETCWDTPLGEGRPGWHIECSAMSMKYLGESFDIHCGGVDLVFPHHENEIAQSEGATGKPFVNFWVHCEFLLVDGEKMAKSKGNQYTLRDLVERGCDPRSVRYLLQSVHYRKPLNFTLEGVENCHSALRRVNDFIVRVREVPGDLEENGELVARIARARSEFEAGLDNDLNTSAALGSLFDLIKETNTLLEEGKVGTPNRDQILALFADANQVLAVFQVEEQQLEDHEILELIEQRTQARRSRDFPKADEIRHLLVERGIVLEDTKEGTRWKRVS